VESIWVSPKLAFVALSWTLLDDCSFCAIWDLWSIPMARGPADWTATRIRDTPTFIGIGLKDGQQIHSSVRSD